MIYYHLFLFEPKEVLVCIVNILIPVCYELMRQIMTISSNHVVSIIVPEITQLKVKRFLDTQTGVQSLVNIKLCKGYIAKYMSSTRAIQKHSSKLEDKTNKKFQLKE